MPTNAFYEPCFATNSLFCDVVLASVPFSSTFFADFLLVFTISDPRMNFLPFFLFQVNNIINII